MPLHNLKFGKKKSQKPYLRCLGRGNALELMYQVSEGMDEYLSSMGFVWEGEREIGVGSREGNLGWALCFEAWEFLGLCLQ